MQEAIRQYYNSIKLLTNQTLSDKMKNEIKDLIKNPEYFKTIPDIVDAYESLKKDIYNKFFSKFNEIVNTSTDKYQFVIPNEPDKIIQLTAGEDSYFYFAYRLVEKDNTKRCRFNGLNDKLQLKDTDILKEKDNAGLFKKYTYKDHKCGSSDWSLFYYCPLNDSNNIKLMAAPEFLSFLDDAVLTEYINSLLKKTEGDFNYFKAQKIK